jgi:hypothetical protein
MLTNFSVMQQPDREIHNQAVNSREYKSSEKYHWGQFINYLLATAQWIKIRCNNLG